MRTWLDRVLRRPEVTPSTLEGLRAAPVAREPTKLEEKKAQMERLTRGLPAMTAEMRYQVQDIIALLKEEIRAEEAK